MRVLTGAIIHECFLIRSLEEQTAIQSGRIQASRPRRERERERERERDRDRDREREKEMRSRRTKMTNRRGVNFCKRSSAFDKKKRRK